MLHRPMPPLSNGLPRRRCGGRPMPSSATVMPIEPSRRPTLATCTCFADGAKDDLADFLVETRVVLVEGDFAVDVALSPELVAELEQPEVQVSAESGRHR
jgi:hypothetical protein